MRTLNYDYRGGRRNRICGFLLGLLIFGAMPAWGAGASETTIYKNKRYRFCFEYPREWARQEGLNGRGVSVTPSGKGHGDLKGAISVGGYVNQPRNLDDPTAPLTGSPPMTLEENFEHHLKAMQDFHHPLNLAVIKKQPEKFQGYPAMLTEISFKNGKAGVSYIERTMWIRRHLPQDTIFTVTLECPQDALESMTPIFDRVLQTLRFRCAN